MSDKKKTIQINPQLFELGKNKKSNKQTRKKRDISIIAPNSIKNEFIRKVKQHQHNKTKKNEINNNTNFSDDFNDTLNYMIELRKEKEKQEKMKEPLITTPDKNSKLNDFLNQTTGSKSASNEIVELELPDILKGVKPTENNIMIQTIPSSNQTMKNKILQPKIKSAIKKPLNLKDNSSVPYGNLKNGSKPTFRTWMKTRKNNENKDINNENENNNVNNVNNEIKPNIKFVTKRICKRRYKCGKSKKYRKVGIVLKSGKMRTKILSDKRTLKIKPIIDVKNELCKNGLLKIGSSAPKQLVYEIYENSKLTGDVKNKNKETLIHNYFNDNSDIK